MDFYVWKEIHSCSDTTRGLTSLFRILDGFPEASLPVAVLILRDTASGTVMIPQTSSIEWKYNGVALTFGSNGLCTTEGLEGVFKKIDSRPTQIGDSSYNLPAIQVLKNLVPISGYDNVGKRFCGSRRQFRVLL